MERSAGVAVYAAIPLSGGMAPPLWQRDLQARQRRVMRDAGRSQRVGGVAGMAPRDRSTATSRTAGLAELGLGRDAYRANPVGRPRMTRLIAAVVLIIAAAAPALACERDKSAATGSQSTVASQAQQSKPVYQHNRS